MIYSHPYICDSEKGEWIKPEFIGRGSFHICSLYVRPREDYNIASGYIRDLNTLKALPGAYIFLLKGDTCKCKLIGPIGRSDSYGLFRLVLEKENCTSFLFYYPEMISQVVTIINCPNPVVVR